MNYFELKQAIYDYTQNGDETTFQSNADLFIKNAEERMFEDLELNVFKSTRTSALSASNRFLTLPDDYLNTISLAITKTNGDQKFLLKKHPSFVVDYITDYTDSALEDEPVYYADYDAELSTSSSVGSTIMVAPVPDTGYTCELNYYYQPASITKLSVFRSLTLGNAPLLTGSAGSNVITVTDTAHGANNQSLVTISGAVTVDGIDATLINTVHKIDNVTTNTYEITIESTDTSVQSGASSGATSGGGNVCVATYTSGANSWFGTFAPTTLLYGSLMEAYTFMKGEVELLQLYSARYEQGITKLRARYSGRNRLEERRHDNLITGVS